MSALTQARFGQFSTYDVVPLPLASGEKVFRNGIACIDTSAHLAKNGASGNANLIPVGEWLDSYDNSAGTGTVQVMCRLYQEITVRWYASDTGGNAVTSSNLYSDVYILDDQTVTTSSSGNSKAGKVWAVDAVKGVGVVPAGLGASGGF